MSDLLERGFVNTAITEVDDFLGMAERKAGAAALVPAIGGGGGVALLESGSHGRVDDVAVKTAVAYFFEFAVPIHIGQPDFAFDMGVGGRCEHERDAAVGRKLDRRRHRATATGLRGSLSVGRLKGAGGNGFRQDDSGIGQCQGLQTLARPGGLSKASR